MKINRNISEIILLFLVLYTTIILTISTGFSAPNKSGNTAVDIAPTIGNVAIDNITETSVTIIFTVDQNDADTIIHYGNTSRNIGLNSDWNNETSESRAITVSGLSSGKKYFYSIFAFNNTNKKFSKSPVDSFTTNNIIIPSAPAITNVNASITSNDSATISFELNESADTIIHYGTNENLNKLSEWNNETSLQKQISLTGLDNDTKYFYSVSAYNKDNLSFSSNSAIDSFTTLKTVINETNNTKTNTTNNTNNNPSAVLPNTGNRIWDETKGLNTTYIWNSYSFSGFYYDLDNNLSTENLVISNIQRNIGKGNLVYSTSPVEIDFAHSEFGSYQVIGFMADKYFAGYTSNSTISDKKVLNVMGYGQLQKILIDDDDKRTVSEGGTLSLEEGYVLKLKAVDVGAGTGQILLSLLKDGTEVDDSVVSAGQDYIYTKKVGSIDLPIIAVHFDSVFRGTEVNAAFVKGVFQISGSRFSVNAGDNYGLMEISDIGPDKITMDNKDSISLSSGETINLMGNLNIIVAKSDTLRFALSVNTAQEARGTIYPVTNGWSPYNFGLNYMTNNDNTVHNIGFYYDLDEDIGTENLQITDISGDSIPKSGITYSTSPQEVSFIYPDFGNYQVIGFMADKYFAGFTKDTNPPNPTSSIGVISAISQGELHKILMDDEDKRTISLGGTLTLEDGYVIKAEDIDLNARTMLISLLKDGQEVDRTPLSAGDTYIYEKKVGGINNLPLIMMRFDSVFSGTEVQAAFIKGLFQISEESTSVKTGDDYGSMEISSVSANGIEMTNPSSIGLSPGNTVDLMGNIQFKVADSSDLRFYPFVQFNLSTAINQLVIDNPDKATAGDNITINVTADNIGIGDASIDIEPTVGVLSTTTNSNGILNYSIPKTLAGTYNITASKTGYQSANSTIQIEKYIAGKLNIIVPSVLDQFQTIPIRVISNETNIDNATLMYDNNTIGNTNKNGVLNFTLQDNGTHTLTASKDSYIPVSLDISIRAPFSDFRSQDINIIPNSTFTNDKVVIESNITNVGTKGDTKLIDLYVNGSSVANKSVHLEPNELKEITFNYSSKNEGNYTVEILGQKGTLSVAKAPFNFLNLGIILTVIGAFVIYLLTRKSTTTIGEYLGGLKNKIKDRKNGRTL